MSTKELKLAQKVGEKGKKINDKKGVSEREYKEENGSPLIQSRQVLYLSLFSYSRGVNLLLIEDLSYLLWQF